MANIEKRITSAGTAYRAKVRLKGFAEQSATFEPLTDARKWAQDTESAIRNRRHFPKSEAKKHTLAEMIAQCDMKAPPPADLALWGVARPAGQEVL